MRYEENLQRKNRTGLLTRQGNQRPREIRGLAVIGPALFLAGVLICLIAFKIWNLPLTQNGPDWVGKVGGVAALMAGLAICAMYFRQQGRRRRTLHTAHNSSADLAMADYDWDGHEYKPSRRKHLASRTVGPVVVTLFGGGLSYLWWLTGSGELEHGSKVGVAIAAVLLDLLAVFSWGQWLAMVARTLKFGDSRIEFARFPYSLKEPIVIRWQPPQGIHCPRTGRFTLRCVEEWRVRDTDRNTTLYQDELWSGTWRFDQAQEWIPGELIDFTFEPCREMRPTHLDAERPVFWEFAVNLAMPGPDFVETYLVPVYD